MKPLKEYCMLFTPDKLSQIGGMIESGSFPWIQISTNDNNRLR